MPVSRAATCAAIVFFATFFPFAEAKAADRPIGKPAIGLYRSEANAAEYRGIHQEPLVRWLEKNHYSFETFGDREAADSVYLAKFALVVATSCYIVPETAATGLSTYVRQGGQLLWIDGPARCRHKEFLAVLGIEGGFTYRTLEKAQFRIGKPDHFITSGLGDFRGRGAGNPAVKATGQVLATWGGIGEQKDAQPGANTAETPAIVLTNAGEGRAVLLNWVLWLTREPEAQAVVSQTVEYLLAERMLQTSPWTVRPVDPPAQVAQPEPISLRARLLARDSLAGKDAAVRAVLVDPQGKPTAAPATDAAPLKKTEGGLCYAETSFTLPTQGLADGAYRLAIEGAVGEGTAKTIHVPIRLYGEELARLAAADAKRFRMLRPMFRRILGDYDSEPRSADGRVDIPRLLEAIEAAHMTMYDFLIWHAKTDWEDFQLFLPEAQRRGLKVWITLVPPSEPPPSQPFGLDYVRWATQIGKLSRQYDNLIGLVIDDFWSGANHSLFTPAYITEVVTALRSENPRIAFLPTLYWGTIGDEEFLRDYRFLIDGIVFPYADLDSTKQLPQQLAACRAWLGPDKLLMMNVYGSGSSGTGERGPRTAEYMRSILNISREQSDGIRIYCLPKGDFSDHRFRITAELYEKWRSEDRLPEQN